MLGVGGMQLFRSEAFEQSEKLLPRATEIAFSLLQIYSVLTLATFVALDHRYDALRRIHSRPHQYFNRRL